MKAMDEKITALEKRTKGELLGYKKEVKKTLQSKLIGDSCKYASFADFVSSVYDF